MESHIDIFIRGGEPVTEGRHANCSLKTAPHLDSTVVTVVIIINATHCKDKAIMIINSVIMPQYRQRIRGYQSPLRSAELSLRHESGVIPTTYPASL